MPHDLDRFAFQNFEETSAVVDTRQAVVVRQLAKSRVAFPERRNRGLQSVDDIGHFRMPRGLELNIEVAESVIPDRLLLIGHRT